MEKHLKNAGYNASFIAEGNALSSPSEPFIEALSSSTAETSSLQPASTDVSWWKSVGRIPRLTWPWKNPATVRVETQAAASPLVENMITPTTHSSHAAFLPEKALYPYGSLRLKRGENLPAPSKEEASLLPSNALREGKAYVLPSENMSAMESSKQTASGSSWWANGQSSSSSCLPLLSNPSLSSYDLADVLGPTMASSSRHYAFRQEAPALASKSLFFGEREYVASSEEETSLSSRSNSLDVPPFDSAADESSKQANLPHTVLAIIKSFIGTGVLFLPRAVFNGGMLVYFVSMSIVFACSMYCMLLLIQCCSEDCQTYSSIAEKACGRVGRICVDVSVVLSQLGFCSVYMVFVASNIRDFVLSINKCNPEYDIPLWYLLSIQLIIYIPMGWVRRLNYFSPYFLMGDIFVGGGLAAVLFYVFISLFQSGPQPVASFNPTHWPVMLGTCIYSWEGICMVLPVRSSMKMEIRSHFPKTLFWTLCVCLVVIFCFSMLSYLAYGDITNSIVLYNLPNNTFIYAVQLAYTLAIVFSYPLMMFPVSKAIETRLFYYSMGFSLKRKWAKNALRSILVLLTLVVGNIGLTELDNFVALIGSFCCIPLAFIYPALFYYRLKENSSRLTSFLCLSLIVGGIFCLLFTSFQTIRLWHIGTLGSRCTPPPH